MSAAFSVPQESGADESADHAVAALKALRAARRRNRLADIHWSDALYRVYVVVVGVGIMVWWLASQLGKRHVSAHAQLTVLDRGPAVVGLVTAVLLAAAARSGGRGGPLAIEAADLAHVLQAPVPRRAALTRPFVHQLRRGFVTGAIAFGVVGRLSIPFLPGNVFAWVGIGAAIGALFGVCWMSLATVVSSRRLSAAVSSVLGLAIIAWSALDVGLDRVTSPLSFAGAFAVSPLGRSRAASWTGIVALVAIAAVLLVLALRSVGGVLLEKVERRAALVGQLRFAVSTQDLRAVLLLRRQLTAEHSRVKPWFRVPGWSDANGAVYSRSLRSVARWPLGRVVRVLLCAVVAGLACRAAWEGALPMVLIAGIAVFIAGLDATEALSQDADHPAMLAMIPRHRGRLANRQVVVPVAVLFVFGLLGGVAGALSGPLFGGTLPSGGGQFAAAALLALIGAATGTVGAAVSVAMGPPSLATMLTTPELAYGRSMLAPGLPILGMAVPVIWARSTAHASLKPSAIPGLVRGLFIAGILTYLAVLWLTDGGIRDPNRV